MPSFETSGFASPWSPGHLRRRPAAQRGWALLTMVLAALLVSVSATTAFVSMRLERERERQQELLATGRSLVLALRSYHKAEWATQPEWPRDLSELVEDRRSPTIQRHLRRIPVDPITGKSDWGLLREGGRIIGVHSPSTAKTLIRRGFHPEFTGFEQALTVNEWRFVAALAQPTRP